MRGSIALIWLAALAICVMGVKQEDFKQCHQSSFCRRLRGIADRQAAAHSTFRSPYSLGLAKPTSAPGESSWTFPLSSSLYPEISFELRVDVLAEGEGVIRIRADEVRSKTPWKRYNEAGKWALLTPEPKLASNAQLKHSLGKTTITYGPADAKLSLEIRHDPFRVAQLRDSKEEVVFNDRSLFHMEHFRLKDPQVDAALSESEQVVLNGEPRDRTWFEGESDADSWQEKWKGKWEDSKPKGPEGLSIDISFPGVQHVYGLPEHASPLSLPDTRGDKAHYTEPYRLFNVDIFEYLADSPMSLYGAIPLLHAHSASHSVGVLDLIASDTWVDVMHGKNDVQTHWFSESGILDLLLLPGPRPDHLFKQFASLTGTTPLPPQWSTAYHQCRWNYVNEEDVLEVDRRFDEADIPLDVTWLDIEYAEEHRYFDWDPKYFPDPVGMLNKVAEKARKMVAIVDPHIKKVDSFRIFSDAKKLDILIKKADGTDFEGWCWTGSSVWVDFFNPKSWDWWTQMFDFKTWKGSAKNLFIWNDMNEPSVFDGPEISVPRDSLHYGGWENRDVHNINGMMFHNQTTHALIARETPAQRPFVLSRSFYTGTHRYSAIWTGDNLGDWEHLAGEAAMLLSNNIAGMSFSGADVGGFFGNPSPEMLVRWYQAGIFMPFFRAHAHIDTKRREPYLFDEPIRGYLRDAVRLRYQMLPVWYNAFHDASVRGSPIIRPHYTVFPEDQGGFAIDDQYYIGGEGLLFKPVVQEGAETASVYLADNEPYYNYFDHHMYPASSSSRRISMNTPISTYPLLLHGGHVLPVRQRVRRSSPLMWQDPFTLIVSLGKDGSAQGQLYLDDGVGYDYQKGDYVWRAFHFTSAGKGGSLKSVNHAAEQSTALAAYDPQGNAWAKTIAHVQVERIVVLGLGSKPKSVTVAGQAVEWDYQDGTPSNGWREGRASELTIKRPGVSVVDDWEVVIA